MISYALLPLVMVLAFIGLFLFASIIVALLLDPDHQA